MFLDKRFGDQRILTQDAASSGGPKPKTSRARAPGASLPDDRNMFPPCFVTGLSPDMSASTGEALELRVKVKGDPEPQITWTKDRTAVVSNKSIDLKYKNNIASLTIKEASIGDAGTYFCKATNTKGSVTTSTKVTVAGRDAKGRRQQKKDEAPRIHSHVASKVVKDGEKVNLECSITGPDANAYNVIWLHNFKEIKPSKDFVYSSTGNRHLLEIAEVYPEDAGTYTCEAFNNLGECFSSCTLFVQVPDEKAASDSLFASYPTSASVDKGKCATFQCEAKIAPKQVTWKKDGKEMKEAPMKLKMQSAGSRLTLDVMDCGPVDAGQFELVIDDGKREDKAAFSLNVNLH